MASARSASTPTRTSYVSSALTDSLTLGGGEKPSHYAHPALLDQLFAFGLLASTLLRAFRPNSAVFLASSQIKVCPEHLPNYEAKIKSFFEEYEHQ